MSTFFSLSSKSCLSSSTSTSTTSLPISWHLRRLLRSTDRPLPLSPARSCSLPPMSTTLPRRGRAPSQRRLCRTVAQFTTDLFVDLFFISQLFSVSITSFLSVISLLLSRASTTSRARPPRCRRVVPGRGRPRLVRAPSSRSHVFAEARVAPGAGASVGGSHDVGVDASNVPSSTSPRLLASSISSSSVVPTKFSLHRLRLALAFSSPRCAMTTTDWDGLSCLLCSRRRSPRGPAFVVFLRRSRVTSTVTLPLRPATCLYDPIPGGTCAFERDSIAASCVLHRDFTTSSDVEVLRRRSAGARDRRQPSSPHGLVQRHSTRRLSHDPPARHATVTCVLVSPRSPRLTGR